MDFLLRTLGAVVATCIIYVMLVWVIFSVQHEVDTERSDTNTYILGQSLKISM